MSAPKQKVKSSVNQQIKAGLNAVKEFLAGRSNDEKVVAPEDKATREVVAAELLAAMSGRSTDGASPENVENAPTDTQEIPRFDSGSGAGQETNEPNNSQQPAQSDSPASSDVEEQRENPKEEEQGRARQLFLDHGYFDETVQDLRAASSAAERAAAARALGLVGSQRATAHLIAAMFDDDLEVRSAAEEALSKIGEPAPANVHLEATSPAETESTSAAESGMIELDQDWEAERAPWEDAVIAATKSDISQQAGQEVRAREAPEISVQQNHEVIQTGAAELTATDSTTTSEEQQLLLEENEIRQTGEQLAPQLAEVAAARQKSEQEIHWRTEREAKLRTEASARRLKEEEALKRAEAAAEVRRTEEREAVVVEQTARLKAEAEAQRYADEETNLRLQAVSLRLDSAAVAQRRADLEIARQEAAEAARHAEVMRARDEARLQHEAELKRLDSEKESLQTAMDEVLLQQTKVRAARDQAAGKIEQLKEEQAAVEISQQAEAERLRREAEKKNSEAQEQLRIELENLRQAGEAVARRQAEVEAAREKADEEVVGLVEAQARMQAAEEARAAAEIERAQREAEINQQLEAQVRLIEETRLRGEEEQERLKEELRLGAEKEQQRLAALEVMKTKAELESKDRAEQEQQILSQIDSLRIADAETRRRILDAEVRRRAADDAYRLIAEKVQRVEAEAHARAKEEERMRAKLESERRNAAIAAQSRAEQEKRIREEIEMFRRLEEEERPRIEEATLQLAAAEARLQERKDRLKEDAEARVLAEEELITVGEPQANVAEQSGASERQEKASERLVPTSRDETARPVTGRWAGSEAGAAAEVAARVDDATGSDGIAASAVTPAIATYLNSVDPYKRAAAVVELARSGSQDAFSRIAECFDDHSPHVRNAAARALRKLEPDKTVDMFNRALEEASPDRRRNIGAAIASSGLAAEAINNLASESREDTYNALSILFVMAKTGEVEPLVRALEEHGDDEIGKAVSKLLTLSGHGQQAAGTDGRSSA